jgi:hypothetical protein
MLWRLSTARRTCGNLSSAQVVGEINKMAKALLKMPIKKSLVPVFNGEMMCSSTGTSVCTVFSNKAKHHISGSVSFYHHYIIISYHIPILVGFYPPDKPSWDHQAIKRSKNWQLLHLF